MFSIETLSLIFFTTGFTVGFGHCLGMCGPVVVAFSLSRKEQNPLIPQMLYHAGRILTYGFLGGVMGATGSFTRVFSSLLIVQKSVMAFSGLFIALMGAAMAGWLPPGPFFTDRYCPGKIFSTAFHQLSLLRSSWALLPLGMLLGLLPCGPLYTAFLGVARAGMESETPTQGIITGSVLMLCFGLGTIPALLLITRFVDAPWLRARGYLYRVAAVLMVALGVYFIIRGLRY
jgi:uncharacterized protein